MVTMQKEEKQTILAPFGIEADHPRNGDLLLQSIPNCRLRSAIKASRTTIVNKQSEDHVIPKDQARHLGALPPIPGMELHVNPTNLSYVIVDPLYENKKLCDRIQSAMQADERSIGRKLRGLPPQEGTLDVHRMKTLCREIFYLLDANEVKLKKGIKPSTESIDRLPGHYLLNPGSQVPNNQPLFEKDLPGYVENMQKTGG